MKPILDCALMLMLFVSVNTLIYGVTAVVLMHWHDDISMINAAHWPGIVFYPVLWLSLIMWVAVISWVELMRSRG
jgi:hypothetical protein